MGYGDRLMAIGDAKAQYLSDPLRRPVAIGDGKNVDWSELSDGVPFLADQSLVDSGFPVSWVISHTGNRPYIDYAAMEAKVARIRTGPPILRRRLLAALGHYIFRKDYHAKPAEVRFSAAQNALIEKWNKIPYVVLEPYIKPRAPVNKHWGHENYLKLAERLAKHIRVVQVSEPRHYENLPFVTRIAPSSFKEAMAYIAGSRLYIGPEGGLHHAAAAVGKPAVVIFGGFTDPKMTGYDFHTNLTGGARFACGIKGHACRHCRTAMQNISVDEVLQAALRHLGKA